MEAFKKSILSRHKLNSFVVLTSLTDVDEETRNVITNKSYINTQLTNGLHMMNATYLYTNPPPHGYGTPAPYVAETVKRAYEYVKDNKEDCETELLGNEVIDSAIDDLKDYPQEGVTGTFHAHTTSVYTEKFLRTQFDPIQKSALETINWLKSTNADELCRGRQTWDPASMKSITCPKAFRNFIEIIRDNLSKTPTTILECLIYWMELYECQFLVVKVRQVKVVEVIKYNKALNIREKVKKEKIFLTKKTLKEGEIRTWLDDYTRSFCSYIKHGERGKDKSRAIASASIPMRLLLKIIEEYHLNLSKKIPGSTIAIGGELKKRKIATELEQATFVSISGESYALQGTEDATKWNECLNPSLFNLIHYVLFDKKFRVKNKLQLPTEDEEILLKICHLTFFFMLRKRIHMGLGFILENETHYTRLPWNQTKEENLNEHNKEWFRAVKDKIDTEDYLKASPGFLMGMLNAASTTVGLIPLLGMDLPNTSLKCLRSSDDSMTMFAAIDAKSLIQLMTYTYSLLRVFGINPSVEKTLLFPQGFGEYTSWYQDGDFIGQCGVETSSLKPGGQNPQDDFNNAAALTLNLMRTYNINVMGAISRLCIGINNVRKLWNIKGSTVQRKESISEDVIFLADGGRNPWVIENLSVDEAGIRLRNCKTQADKEYYYKVMNPENPFSEKAEEELLFSKDLGSLVTTVKETPRNVFNYIRRSNRTRNNLLSDAEAEYERNNQEAFEIATILNPSFLQHIPNNKSNLSKYLASTLLFVSQELELDSSEERIIQMARAKLLHVEREEELSDLEEENMLYQEL